MFRPLLLIFRSFQFLACSGLNYFFCSADVVQKRELLEHQADDAIRNKVDTKQNIMQLEKELARVRDEIVKLENQRDEIAELENQGKTGI